MGARKFGIKMERSDGNQEGGWRGWKEQMKTDRRDSRYKGNGEN